jgi:HEAT repeat protein
VARAEGFRQDLRRLSADRRSAYLDAHSGLPGPRGNLELLQAAVEEGDAGWFDQLLAGPDEYRVTVGAVGLGRLLAERADPELVSRLHALAADPRWRVREGVAMALQRLGDADPDRLWALARAWAEDPDPLVQRAAVAGVCEPRLLRRPQAAAQAVRLCAIITHDVAARPVGQRRTAGVRSLRQALGYCWSVAVAADPVAGLPRFLALAENPDPDVAWIVRENRRKARLKRLLEARGQR